VESTEKSDFLEKEFYRIENETYKAVEPFLLPIININPDEITESHHLEGLKLDLKANLPVYNFGRGIAENLTIRFFTAILDRPEIHLWEIPDPEYDKPITTANDIYPEQTFLFTRDFFFIDDSIELGVTRIAFIIRTEYNDKVSERSLSQTFWMFYLVGDKMYHQTIDDKNLILPYYEDLIKK